MSSKKDLFDWADYKELLRFIEQSDRGGYGFRSKLAKVAGVNVAYVSQVLNKDAHFSLEQGELISAYLGHTNDEGDYFLLLLQIARAGSKKLQARLQRQAEHMKAQRLVLKRRVAIASEISPAEQLKYYSSWHYAAIHMAITIEKFRTREAISEALQIPLSKTQDVLNTLTQMGLILENENIYTPANKAIFLGRDSELIQLHHSNWRYQVVDFLHRATPTDIHLSSVFSLHSSEVETIRQLILQTIDRSHDVAKASVNEEELHCLVVDFFKITKE